MKKLMSDLLTHIDRIEASKPRSLPWKPFLDVVIKNIEATSNMQDNSANPLFLALEKQNQNILALGLIGVIASLSK